MTVTILLLLVGLITAVIAGMIMSSRESTKILVRDLLISAALGTGLFTLVLLDYELVRLQELREIIIKPNIYTQLERYLTELPQNSPMRAPIIVYKKQVEDGYS